MALEVELKLDLTPEAVDDLLGCDLLSGEPTTIPQRSIYFDTPGQDLKAQGFSLRIRQARGQRVQTVKATGITAAGLFARPEWEQQVDCDLPVLDDKTPIKALLGTREATLGPAFEVVVQRRMWTLSQEDADFELALDCGEVVAGDRRAPFCEIELELKNGSPAALFSYARRINAAVSSRLSVLSKAERGYRLLGPVVRAVKTEPMMLASDMSILIGAGFVALNGRVPTDEEAQALAAEYAPAIERHALEVYRDDAQECLDHLLSHVVDGYPLGHWLASLRDEQQRRGNNFADAERIVTSYAEAFRNALLLKVEEGDLVNPRKAPTVAQAIDH